MRFSSTLFAFAVTFSKCLAEDWQSPVYNHFYEFPMPIPPVKEVKFTFTNPTTGLPIDYYEIEIKALTRQQYPELPPTRMVGYDGIVPGMLNDVKLLHTPNANSPSQVQHFKSLKAANLL
jgi:bilirubin oxidase